MPPRRASKRSADEAVGSVEGGSRREEVQSLNGERGFQKRPRRSSVVHEDAKREGVNGQTPPPPPEEEEEEDDPPPPEEEVPPPPPPADAESLDPPPPPEEADEERRAEIARQQELDEDEIGGADYWAKLAKQGVAKRGSSEKEEEEQGGRKALYLDTINRSLLDFDFEKLCSVSLSNINVYACLVCGKYFQGRGPNSYAYFHAINGSHRVFMHMETGQVFILPDNYKVNDPSLNDIKYLLQPTYSERHIKQLDAPDVRSSFDLRGNPYHAGFVGLNNLGANDYMNVIVQALAHVRPLRNFFLRGGPPAPKGSAEAAKTLTLGKTVAESDILLHSTELVRRFAMLMRKIWNPRNTKAQVSPHEFYQEVVNASKGRFSITQQGDPVEFMGWLLNRLHADLGGGGKKNKRSIISDCFQGVVRIESQKVFVRSGIELEDEEMDGDNDKLDSDGRREGGQEDDMGHAKFNIDREVKVDRTSFFFLTIDLPPVPVFQDVIEKNIIPQVPIAEVLAKYDGITFQEARGLIRRFKTLNLPPFLILHYKRFTKNKFIEERNRTIVNYPVSDLSMADYVEDPSNVALSTVYDLVANVTLEATAGTVRENCLWRSQVHSFIDGKPIGTPAERQERLRQERIGVLREELQNAGRDVGSDQELLAGIEGTLSEEEKWFSTQDLLVDSIDKQLLFLGETYIQIWARRA